MLHLCFSLKTQQQRPVQRKTQQVPSAPECQQALGAGKLRSHHLWCWQEAISEGNSLKPVLDSNPQREREILGRRCLCGCLGTWSQLKKRQVLACRTGAGFLLPFWVDKGLLTPHFKDLAYHTAFEPTQISKTEEETLEGCCSPQSTSAWGESHFPVDDTSHLKMSLFCVELWLHPFPAVPAVVQSHITDVLSCWSEASASQGLAGAELSRAGSPWEPPVPTCSAGAGGCCFSVELAAPSGKFLLRF